MTNYISLSNAAVYENESYEAFKKRVQRNRETYVTQHVPRTSGGRELVLVAVSSLSYSAQQRYKAAHPESFQEEPSPVERAYIKEEERPWYVDADYLAFIHQHQQEYFGVLETIAVLQEFFDYCGPDRDGKAEKLAESLGIKKSAFYEKCRLLREARAWNDRVTRETGASRPYFEQMALCRKPMGKNRFPSMAEEMKALAKAVWFNPKVAANLPDFPLVYQLIQERAEVLGIEGLPSEATFKRYIEHVMTHEGGQAAHDLAENGLREFRRSTMIKGRSVTKPLMAMECVMSDGHTFDLFIQIIGKNGKKQAVRPVLVCFIDVKTRMILGDVICLQVNAQVIKQAVHKMVYGTPGGVPRILRMDNGKEFTAETNTGQNRRERQCTLDSEIHGFYQSMGIELWKRAKPYQGWSKAQIERVFRTVINRFSKRFDSYVGTLTGSKTKGKRKKDIQGMLGRGELLTLEQFVAEWEKFKEWYQNHEHRGLKDAGEAYITPLSLWEHCEHYQKAAPPIEMGRMLLMQAAARKVQAGNIRHNKRNFSHYALAAYNNRWINIRWDPEAEEQIFCFDQETGALICEATAVEGMSHTPGETSKVLEAHMREQKRQEKAAKDRLKELISPTEKEGAPTPNVAAASLLIGNAPEKKVVAFPQDKEYRASLDAKRSTGYEPTAAAKKRYEAKYKELLAQCGGAYNGR